MPFAIKLYGNCTGCGACAEACPKQGILTVLRAFRPLDPHTYKPAAVDHRTGMPIDPRDVLVVRRASACDGCGRCMLACPEDVLAIRIVPTETPRDAPSLLHEDAPGSGAPEGPRRGMYEQIPRGTLYVPRDFEGTIELGPEECDPRIDAYAEQLRWQQQQQPKAERRCDSISREPPLQPSRGAASADGTATTPLRGRLQCKSPADVVPRLEEPEPTKAAAATARVEDDESTELPDDVRETLLKISQLVIACPRIKSVRFEIEK
jgi:Fe-S-cluster-containing hydrogenase component 2